MYKMEKSHLIVTGGHSPEEQEENNKRLGELIPKK